MLEWIETHTEIISLAASLLLLIVTGVYVYLTKRMLETSQSSLRLSLNPVIGVEVRSMKIGAVYGQRRRRELNVDLLLTNVGNAPAIEVGVDGEIILEHSQIKGHKAIPQRYEPQMIPYIMSDLSPTGAFLAFGNTLLTHLFDDFREYQRLNIHRIQTTPTSDSYEASRLRVIVTYRNSVGQYYASTYTVRVHLGDFPKVEIPQDDEKGHLVCVDVHRAQFHAGPIPQDEADRSLASRNGLRFLCGW